MKNQNLFIYSILAIGLISVPSLLDTVQAQVNMTNTTSSSVQNQTAQTQANQTAQNSQNQTISKETQALMTLDIPVIKDQLMNAKTSLLNNNTEEALTGISGVEIQLLLLPNKPSFVGDIQTIKNSIAKPDINKALDDLTKVQTDILKAETEALKAELANPQLSAAQQNNDAQDEDDNENN
ncbi:MAG TPA: hypothetical protein VF222_06515 [Nitrososphaeraceae archaeon]